jgi:predicted transcriptional regulator
MFSISKVAEQLQVTPQAIYKQRDYLLDNGYMVKDKF